MTSANSKTRFEPFSDTGNSNMILLVTYTNIMLYAASYQLQRPVEPYLVQQLVDRAEDEASVTHVYGQLQSFFAIVQTIGSPMVGALLDRWGIRFTSAVIFGASAISYAILAVADNLPMLFLSKVPAMLQHAFLVAQAAAAAATRSQPNTSNSSSSDGRGDGTDAARAAALGRMTTAYTVGATLGPALGGWLAASGDYYQGSRLAVMGSLISVILSLVYFPDKDSTDVTKASHGDVKATSSTWSEVTKKAMSLLRRNEIWPLMTVKMASGITTSMLLTILPIICTQDLAYTPDMLGMQLAVTSAATAIVGATALAPLTQWLGVGGLASAGLVVRAVMGFVITWVVAAALTPSAGSSFMFHVPSDRIQYAILAAIVIYYLACHGLSTALTTASTGAVATEEQGTLLGLEHALFSFSRAIGPQLGTWILTKYNSKNDGVLAQLFAPKATGIGAVTIVCGVLDVVLLSLLMQTAASRKASTSKAKKE